MKTEDIGTQKITVPEIQWGQEKLIALMRYAQYAERCAWHREIPEKYSVWKEIVKP